MKSFDKGQHPSDNIQFAIFVNKGRFLIKWKDNVLFDVLTLKSFKL